MIDSTLFNIHVVTLIRGIQQPACRRANRGELCNCNLWPESQNREALQNTSCFQGFDNS